MRATIVQAADPVASGDHDQRLASEQRTGVDSNCAIEGTQQGMEKGKEETLQSEDETPPGAPTAPTGMLSSKELAEYYGLGPERVRKALGQYRIGHDEAWIEVTERRPREPKYLYDPKAVAALLERMWET